MLMKNPYPLLVVWLLFSHSLSSQTDSCLGNTWIKLFGQPGTNERGSALYPAGDGNIYATGSSPDSAVILKINPNGEILWSRSFDFLPGYDDITHLSIDSDGMLLGVVVSSPLFNGYNYSCYFKYDPQQEKLLWVWRPGFYTAYAALKGISEKYSGGNYIINFYSNFPPAENVIMEIDRQTGQEISGTSWRYGGSDIQPLVLNDSLI